MPIRDNSIIMPKPIRHCHCCHRILPPWSRADARYCGDTCRQTAHRQWRRRKPCGVMPAAGPIEVRDQQTQITDIEPLMASLDATSERVMANVAKITKPGKADDVQHLR